MDELRRKRLVLGFRELLSKHRQRQQASSSAPSTARKTILQTSAPSAQPRERQRVNMEVTFNAAGETTSGQAIDLSTGGIGIRGSANQLTAGTELEMMLRLPQAGTEEWLKVRGVVCYQADSRFGVRFVNLTFADEKRILELIAPH